MTGYQFSMYVNLNSLRFLEQQFIIRSWKFRMALPRNVTDQSLAKDSPSTDTGRLAGSVAHTKDILLP